MTRTRPASLVLLAVLGVALALAVLRAGGDRPSRGAGPAAVAVPAAVPVAGAVDEPREASALDVLHQWDVQRSAAWAAGSARRLRDLYVAGSGAGASDVRLLRDYRARGYRVEGMRMQVLALRLLEERPDRLRVEVTDRLDGAVAVHAGRRLTLPTDRPSTRTVTLVRGADGTWRVAAVEPLR